MRSRTIRVNINLQSPIFRCQLPGKLILLLKYLLRNCSLTYFVSDLIKSFSASRISSINKRIIQFHFIILSKQRYVTLYKKKVQKVGIIFSGQPLLYRRDKILIYSGTFLKATVSYKYCLYLFIIIRLTQLKVLDEKYIWFFTLLFFPFIFSYFQYFGRDFLTERSGKLYGKLVTIV